MKLGKRTRRDHARIWLGAPAQSLRESVSTSAATPHLPGVLDRSAHWACLALHGDMAARRRRMLGGGIGSVSEDGCSHEAAPQSVPAPYGNRLKFARKCQEQNANIVLTQRRLGCESGDPHSAKPHTFHRERERASIWSAPHSYLRRFCGAGTREVSAGDLKTSPSVGHCSPNRLAPSSGPTCRLLAASSRVKDDLVYALMSSIFTVYDVEPLTTRSHSAGESEAS